MPGVVKAQKGGQGGKAKNAGSCGQRGDNGPGCGVLEVTVSTVALTQAN